MNGLTEIEKCGLRHLLETTNDSNLIIQLSKNLVGNTITVDDTEEAFRIIFLHSSDIHEILSKRVLTKEILFKYLHRNEYPVRSDFTKVALISKIIEFWHNHETTATSSSSSSSSTSSTAFVKKEETDYSSSSQFQTSPTLRLSSSPRQGDEEQQQSVVLSRSVSPGPSRVQVLAERTVTNTATISHYNSNNESDFPINKMARQFSEWFFKKYNEYSICIDDFWLDSQFILRILTTDNLIENEYEIREDIIEALNNIKMQYDFYFNPTMSHEGVQGRLDMHGLALVLVCGTLHNRERCCGIFESVFSLARDPYSQNNWKIKKIQMLLRNIANQNQQIMPNLADSEAMQPVLNLPISPDDI